MATLSAAAYGAAAVYFGGGSTATAWPPNMGGGGHNVNVFMTGFSSPYLTAPATPSTLKARKTAVYYNITGDNGFFASHLVASMAILPARIGPAPAIGNVAGSRPYI